MQAPPAENKYTPEEKQQLLANLDLEVEHRTRQFQEWLNDTLENFRIHQEGQISIVPRIVRNITMRDFAKYNGDVQECLRGLQREKLGVGETGPIDKSTRKRKWVASQEDNAKAGPSSQELEPARASKTARMMVATPKKGGPSTVVAGTQRGRLPIMKTPSTVRTAQRILPRAPSPSPYKPPTTKSLFTRLPSRPASPTKTMSSTKPSSPSKPTTSNLHRPTRPPSAATFNPAIPVQPRWPRKDESMLSVNGSPIANPYALGLGGWFQSVAGGMNDRDDDSDDGGGGMSKMGSLMNAKSKKPLKKVPSIIVRNATNGQLSRSNSQSQTLAVSQSSAHSRSNSQTGFMPKSNFQPSSQTHSRSNSQTLAPPPPLTLQPSLTALVSVPTQDGHVLEFDALQTSPQELDQLEGITDSAKNQAKLDMVRLIQAAVDRWKIG